MSILSPRPERQSDPGWDLGGGAKTAYFTLSASALPALNLATFLAAI